ncbi:MAG: type II toxin-antitoxin system RelE/ParE family toxin [Acidobacteriaceae bacterium]|nr:type II toxin-antitoxin system RelE/ParE family toxin [Acidobacteriaceae bacterium]
MDWEVEYTDEFEEWWNSLTENEQSEVQASVKLLSALGPGLKFPHSSGIAQSKHSRMRELRTQCEGRPLRTLYVFDPRRVAILSIGGDQTGNHCWYDEFIPKADRIYDQHLQELRKEGNWDG